MGSGETGRREGESAVVRGDMLTVTVYGVLVFAGREMYVFIHSS